MLTTLERILLQQVSVTEILALSVLSTLTKYISALELSVSSEVIDAKETQSNPEMMFVKNGLNSSAT